MEKIDAQPEGTKEVVTKRNAQTVLPRRDETKEVIAFAMSSKEKRVPKTQISLILLYTSQRIRRDKEIDRERGLSEKAVSYGSR
jgi:hypothetical protein